MNDHLNQNAAMAGRAEHRLPAIAVVTPSFNQAHYLEHTLHSVLDQGYPSLEYVVVDAGSSDGSADIVRGYADRLTWWVSEPDRGHADGLNKGFAHTTAEIMGWVNSSDVHFPWTLATVGRIFAERQDVDWIVGLPAHIDRDGAFVGVWPMTWNRYDLLSQRRYYVQQESVFWRRRLWERAGGGLDADVKYACDYELWLRFFEHADLYHVSAPLAGFRFHELRRAETGHDYYADDVRALARAACARLDARMQRRVRLVSATNGRLAQAAREGLSRAHVLPWYRHPRVIYDGEAQRWRTA